MFPDRLVAGRKILALLTVVRIHLWEFYIYFVLNKVNYTKIAPYNINAGCNFFVSLIFFVGVKPQPTFKSCLQT